MNYLRFPNKAIRARVIAKYVRRAGYRGVVCFSCGNASAELRKVLPFVVDISPTGGLVPTLQWSPEAIHTTWPELLDATSGHLPVFLMIRVAGAFREYLGFLSPKTLYHVPTGSGETITCLRWAYPAVHFTPCSDGTPATKADARAPLWLVAASQPCLFEESKK